MSTAPGITLDRPAVDWERDQYQRPKIRTLGTTGKPRKETRSYTRVTTFAAALDDGTNLMRWRMRRVLLGVAARPDYVTQALALTDRDDDKAALNELAEKCLEAAGPDKAGIGTALHAFTERLDRGEPLGNVPEQYRASLDAYLEATACITWTHRECRTVHDELEVAGTPDGFGYCSIPDPDGVTDALRVIDTKTGRIDYPAKFSTQLAIYAHSDLYDPATGLRTPIEVNTRWGIITHLPPDRSGEVELLWLPLEPGWRGALIAGPVRDWRKESKALKLVPFVTLPAKADDEVNGTPAPPSGLDTPEAAEAAGEAAERGEATVEAASHFPRGMAATQEIADHVNIAELIDAADAPSEIELLWQRYRADGWTAQHDQLARLRVEELRDRQAAERPSAALEAAARTAGTADALKALWDAHGRSALWTQEVADAAAARYAELNAAATDEPVEAPPAAADPDVKARAALVETIMRADSPAKVGELWRLQRDRLWGPEHDAAAAERIGQLEPGGEPSGPDSESEDAADVDGTDDPDTAGLLSLIASATTPAELTGIWRLWHTTEAWTSDVDTMAAGRHRALA